jgi:hypothetical protein
MKIPFFSVGDMGSDNGVEQLKNFFSQKIDIGIRQFRPFALNEPQEFLTEFERVPLYEGSRLR